MRPRQTYRAYRRNAARTYKRDMAMVRASVTWAEAKQFTANDETYKRKPKRKV